MAQPAQAAAAPRAPSITPEQARQRKLKYQVIYPQYLDSSLARKNGRRLTDKQSVAHPTLQEMFQACVALGFKGGVDAQLYADPTKSLPCAQSQAFCIPPQRGCIKIAIKEPVSSVEAGEARESLNSKAPTKMAVMRGIADFIRNIPDRKVQTHSREQQVAQMSADAMAEHMAKSSGKKAKGPKAQRIKVRR